VSVGTLPSGTVFTGGIGGGAVFWSASPESLRGGWLTVGGASLGLGWRLLVSAGAIPLVGWAALGQYRRGIGRLAEGASGISSGFCCVQPARPLTAAYTSMTALVLFAILPDPKPFLVLGLPSFF